MRHEHGVGKGDDTSRDTTLDCHLSYNKHMAARLL